MMRVRLVDYRAAYERDREAIDAAIRKVLEAGELVMGPDVRAFEEEFAAYVGVAYAHGVHSGTSALLLGLRALGIGPGDEVITVANSDIPTSLAVTHTGARVVWVDIDPRTFTMDPNAVEAAITPRTKAILPVHLYGVPADMNPILEIAARRDLVVVEDACLAAGARYRGQPAGSMGQVAAFSTAPGKLLGGVGTGGVVATSNAHLHERLKSLRNYGRARSPYAEDLPPGPKMPSPTVELGYNERLDTIQAAVLRIRLQRIDEDVARRLAVAEAYTATLRGSPVGIPEPTPGSDPAWHVYTVRVPRRDQIYAELYQRGYEVALRYLPPNHLDECYRFLGYKEGDLPETERAARELLCLPVHPFMTSEDALEVAAALLELVE